MTCLSVSSGQSGLTPEVEESLQNTTELVAVGNSSGRPPNSEREHRTHRTSKSLSHSLSNSPLSPTVFTGPSLTGGTQRGSPGLPSEPGHRLGITSIGIGTGAGTGRRPGDTTTAQLPGDTMKRHPLQRRHSHSTIMSNISDQLTYHASDAITSEKDMMEDAAAKLESFSLFQGTNQHFLQRLVRKYKPRLYKPSDPPIIKYGEVGRAMYFIYKGVVDVLSEDGETMYARLGEGLFFGEVALLFSVPRTATVVAATKCICFSLRKDDLESVLMDFPLVAQSIRQVARERFAVYRELHNSPKPCEDVPFAELTEMHSESQQRSICHRCEFGFINMLSLTYQRQTYPADTFILLEGQQGSSMYFIVRGAVQIVDYQGQIQEHLGPMEFFGEMATFVKAPYCASAVTTEETDLIELSRETLETLLPNYPEMHARIMSSVELRTVKYKVDTTLQPRRTWLPLTTVPFVRHMSAPPGTTVFQQPTRPLSLRSCAGSTSVPEIRAMEAPIPRASLPGFDMFPKHVEKVSDDIGLEFNAYELAQPSPPLLKLKKLSRSCSQGSLGGVCTPLGIQDTVVNHDISISSSCKMEGHDLPTPPSACTPEVLRPSSPVGVGSSPIPKVEEELPSHSHPPLGEPVVDDKEQTPSGPLGNDPSHKPVNITLTKVQVYARRKRSPSIAVFTSPFNLGDLPKVTSPVRTKVAGFSKALGVQSPLMDRGILVKIFLHLPVKDRCMNMAVCTLWNEVLMSSEELWRHMDLSTANKKVTDRVVDHMLTRHGAHVQYLSLHNCWGISNDSLRSIALNCPQLTALSLFSCWEVTSAGVSVLVEACSSLRKVDLSNCRKITDEAIIQLAKYCIQLEHLELSYCKNLTDVSLVHILARCRRILFLNLQRCTGIPRDAFMSFVKHKAYDLQTLVLSDLFQLTDTCLEQIAQGCPALRNLTLSFCCGLGPAALRALGQWCSQLQSLDLTACSNAVTNVSIETLLHEAALTSTLRTLILRNCTQLTDETLFNLDSRCTALELVNVANCK
eukprot:Ihof_evm4s71 gene=Ihof_evmTU4s71